MSSRTSRTTRAAVTVGLLAALGAAAFAPTISAEPGGVSGLARTGPGPMDALARVEAATTSPFVRTPTAATTNAQDTPTATPIKHFIYLMQENHSFDNYFGTYPGADGFPEGACVPVRIDEPDGECIEPYWLGGAPISDLGHTERVFRAQLNAGKNDGFIEAFAEEGDPTRQAMGYYDDRDIPYYWNVADEYVLFDRFFTSAGGGSVWNHMYWVAGVPGNPKGDSIPADGFGDIPTIFDRLEEKGVSWKFYIQNYDPSVTYRTYRTVDDANKGAQVVWAPVLAYARFLDDPRLSSKIVPLDEYYRDLAEGTLPSVAYIVPSGASEHPPGSVSAGERFVRGLHTALMRSEAWESSAFLWTYDDWGGWYDHVVPPQVDAYGYGYRAPTLLVSSYARRGHIESATLDFTSGLKFIQHNWGVEPLAERDRRANNILGAFDFTKPPREAALLSDERNPPREFASPQRVIYLAYGGGLALPATAIVLGTALWSLGTALWSRRRREVG